MTTHLLIIDPQNSFCSPEGELYVSGAENDMQRLSLFISENKIVEIAEMTEKNVKNHNH